jgi:hypothetical protein
VTPSTVTWVSPMASSRALWVRGVARLISSASRMWLKAGPGRNSNWRVFWLKTETPVMSFGSRSGVHWTRLNSSPVLVARARASMVLPVPGASSISTCPSHSSAINNRSMTGRFPTMTFSTLSIAAPANSRIALILLALPVFLAVIDHPLFFDYLPVWLVWERRTGRHVLSAHTAHSRQRRSIHWRKIRPSSGWPGR